MRFVKGFWSAVPRHRFQSGGKPPHSKELDGFHDLIREALPLVEVLAPIGVRRMQLGKTLLEGRAAGEVRYYDENDRTGPAVMGQIGKPVPWPYGAWYLEAMDSHGGWLATPSEIVKFATHVDGFNSSTSILRKPTIKTMTTPSAANHGYASGWCVNQIPNWWHDGNLPGSVSIMVRTARGLCWAAFANTRAPGIDLDRMMWKMAKAVPAWRA